MKWFNKKEFKPDETVDLTPEYICSRCKARFVIDPQGYCPECEYGRIVEFTRQTKEEKEALKR